MRSATCTRLFAAVQRLEKAVLTACAGDHLDEAEAAELAQMIDTCSAAADYAGTPAPQQAESPAPARIMLSERELDGMDSMLDYSERTHPENAS